MTRILVVEDENFLAMELTWIVEDAGYSVVGPERSVAETSKMLAWNKVDLALRDDVDHRRARLSNLRDDAR